MPKQGEIDFLRNLSPEVLRYAADKPFSDPDCGQYLMSLGAIFHLLPAPPGRLLDLGCGAGWTSCFFARRGYDVVGQDICADTIELANDNRFKYHVDNVDFVISDYEYLPFNNEFDCAVFHDSLHHAVDEEAALRGAFRALKPGAPLVVSEPGAGHARKQQSIDAMRDYGITEKDMPPRHVIRLARKIGFSSWRVFPHVKPYTYLLYGARPGQPLFRLSRLPQLLKHLALAFYAAFRKRAYGIVVLTK
ncbi:MAG: class I SAM-dependent methyltransferase [Gemmataceae bacterium]